MIALSIEEDNKYLLNEEVLELTLPCNWWNTSNSFSFYANGTLTIQKITETSDGRPFTEPNSFSMEIFAYITLK